jgi:site-specific recombinase XerD
MGVVKDIRLFTLVHDFFEVYLPVQRGSSPHTIKSYKTALNTLLDFVQAKKKIRLADITFKMIDRHMLSEYLDSVEAAGCGVSTRNLRLNSVRAFYAYAAKIDPVAVIFQEEIRKVPLKKSGEPDVVEYLSEAAVKAILNAPDTSTEKGIRDQFLMLIFYDTAARISEVRKAKLRDIRLSEKPTIKLHGKRGKTRIVPLSEKVVQHLHNYISLFHPREGVFSESFLFYSPRTGSKKPLGESTIRDLMTLYCNEARSSCGDVPENINPHMWRHSRAMHLYQHGMDLTLISQWLGHTDLETTLIYARADTEHKRKAIEAAVPSDSPLKSFVNPERFTVNDDEVLKRLYGLR